jgi:hypothetical protein
MMEAAATADEPRWRSARARVRSLAFDHDAGGSAARLWAALQEAER